MNYNKFCIDPEYLRSCIEYNIIKSVYNDKYEYMEKHFTHLYKCTLDKREINYIDNAIIYSCYFDETQQLYFIEIYYDIQVERKEKLKKLYTMNY